MEAGFPERDSFGKDVPMKSKKHVAEQFVSPVLDPGVKLSLTLNLTGDTARLWRSYLAAHADLAPSHAQLAVALIGRALRDWDGSAPGR